MMPDFVKRQLKDLLITKLRAWIRSVSTVQSENALDWLIGVIIYLLVVIVGSTALGDIPGITHMLILYPLSAYGVMSLINKLNT